MPRSRSATRRARVRSIVGSNTRPDRSEAEPVEDETLAEGYDEGVANARLGADEDEVIIWDGPSKSQRKRDMIALQKLGEELAAQPRDRLAKVPMPDELRDAIHEAQRIKDFEGKRRQMQYVGKVMRNIDPEPLRAALDAFKGSSRAEAAKLHALEDWRARLLADDKALTELASEHSAALNPATMQQLRTSIRMARKEQLETRPPKHFREIFKLLKQIIYGEDAEAEDQAEALDADLLDADHDEDGPQEYPDTDISPRQIL